MVIIAIALWMRPQRHLPDKREALDPELSDVHASRPARLLLRAGRK
jgi:hypothetical protein